MIIMTASTNLIIQYTLVGLILAGVVAYIIWKLFHIKKRGGASSCCGCALSDACNNKKRDDKKRDCCQ